MISFPGPVKSQIPRRKCDIQQSFPFPQHRHAINKTNKTKYNKIDKREYTKQTAMSQKSTLVYVSPYNGRPKTKARTLNSRQIRVQKNKKQDNSFF